MATHRFKSTADAIILRFIIATYYPNLAAILNQHGLANVRSL